MLDPRASHTELPSLAPIATRFPNLVSQSQLQQLDNEWCLLGCSTLLIDIDTDTPLIDQYWGLVSQVKKGIGEL